MSRAWGENIEASGDAGKEEGKTLFDTYHRHLRALDLSISPFWLVLATSALMIGLPGLFGRKKIQLRFKTLDTRQISKPKA